MHPNIQSSDITELLEKSFDRIYVIHVLGIPHIDERWKNTINEFKRIGLYDCKKLEYVYDVRTPYDNDMFAPLDNHLYAKYCDKLDRINNQAYQIGAKKCTFTHYKILKQSYILGYQRILIIEDDVVFLKNLYHIYTLLKNLPKLDLILMDYFMIDPRGVAELDKLRQSCPKQFDKYLQGTISGMPSTSFYAATSNAMKYIVDLYENLYVSNKEIPFIHTIIKANGDMEENVETHKMNFPNSDTFTNNANTKICNRIYSTYNNGEIAQHVFQYMYNDLYMLPDNIITRGFPLYNICIQGSAIEKKDYEWVPSIFYQHIKNLDDYNLKE